MKRLNQTKNTAKETRTSSILTIRPHLWESAAAVNDTANRANRYLWLCSTCHASCQVIRASTVMGAPTPRIAAPAQWSHHCGTYPRCRCRRPCMGGSLAIQRRRRLSLRRLGMFLEPILVVIAGLIARCAGSVRPVALLVEIFAEAVEVVVQVSGVFFQLSQLRLQFLDLWEVIVTGKDRSTTIIAHREGPFHVRGSGRPREGPNLVLHCVPERIGAHANPTCMRVASIEITRQAIMTLRAMSSFSKLSSFLNRTPP